MNEVVDKELLIFNIKNNNSINIELYKPIIDYLISQKLIKISHKEESLANWQGQNDGWFREVNFIEYEEKDFNKIEAIIREYSENNGNNDGK